MKAVKYISMILFLSLGFSTQAQTDDSTHYDMSVAAILPFFTHLEVDTAGPPPRREWRMREIAMDHVMGLRWASHRLAEAGFNVELNLFDEVPDSLGARLWELKDIDSCDIVMGPLQQSMLSRSIRTVENSGAEHILLTKVNPHIVRGGDHIRSILPSQNHFIDLVIEDVLEDYYTRYCGAF